MLPNGWTEIDSVPLSSLGVSRNTATIDVRLPEAVYWGEVRLIFIAPSKGVWWMEAGSSPLCNLSANNYHTLSFALNADAQNLISGVYSDLKIKVVVNAPRLSSPYLIDNLVLAEDSSVDSDTGSEESGDTYTVVVKTPRSVTFEKTALSATERLKIGANVKVESPWLGISTITTLGVTDEKLGEPDADLGNLWSIGHADLGDRVRVRGSIYASSVTLGNGATVDGTIVTDAVFEPAEELSWTVTFPTSGNDEVWLEPNESATLSPGKYSTVRVGPDATAEFSTGTYYLDTLIAEANSKIKLEQDKGPVIVYVRGNLVFRANIETKNNDTPDWLLVYLGNGDVNFDKVFSGTVIAVASKLTLHSAHHTGAFFAKGIVVEANAVITHMPGLSILIANDESLDKCTSFVPPRENLTGNEKEVAFQKDQLRYCIRFEGDDCYRTLLAKVQVDRTTAALQFVNRTITGSQYLGLCRDRTRKLRRARNDVLYAQTLCTGGDEDGDWVIDTVDQCPGTLELYPTDDEGCPAELPETPDDDTVIDLVNNTSVVFDEACKASEVPGIAVPGGFFRRSNPSLVYVVIAKPSGQTPGCLVTYEFELVGWTMDDKPAHLFMYFRESEQTHNLVGLGKPVPNGLVQFEVTPEDGGHRAKLATDIKPYKGKFRARAFNSKGQRGHWSEWMSMTQKDCLSLGFRCANAK